MEIEERAAVMPRSSISLFTPDATIAGVAGVMVVQWCADCAHSSWISCTLRLLDQLHIGGAQGLGEDNLARGA